MKTILIFLLASVLSIEAMDTNSFSSLIDNMKGSLDSNRIDMLKNSSSETYTCQQVKEILELMSLGNYRVDAFKILSTQIEDPENKGIIMSTFQSDLGNYKAEAFKISNSIKITKKKEKEEANENDKRKSKTQLSGTFMIDKSVDNCSFENGVYGLADMVTPSFKLNRKVGTTSYSLWISYCTSGNHNSCTTPFSKRTEDILPDWDGLTYSEPVSMNNLLTNNGTDVLPKYNIYNLSIIINNKLVAEKMIKINKKCK